MENGVFQKLVINRLKNNQNKTEIKLCINNVMDLYNHFSVINNGNVIEDNNAIISDEIIDYLKKETENIPKRNGLKICVKTNEKIKFIEKLIKQNIKRQISKINEKARKMNRNSFVLAFIGIILIAVTQIYQIIEKRYALNELIIVMSWVFMWKAVEIFFFERAKLIKEKTLLLKIYYSEIIEEE